MASARSRHRLLTLRSPVSRLPRACALGLLPALLVAHVASAVQAVGEAHRTATSPSAAVRDAQHRADLRITIWYPAADNAVEKPILIGEPKKAVFRVGTAAANAPFAADPPQGRRPVILLSHGFGGTARIMGWFGIAMAREGYIVISVDHPGNNGADQMTVPGGILWWERAEDLKTALASLSQDQIIGPHMDTTRVGAAGFSAGGFTSLVLGGARADPALLKAFCKANPDDGICRPQLEFTITEDDVEKALQDPQIAALEAHASDDHSLPAVKAVFAMAPAIVQAIKPDSFGEMKRPVTIVAGDADTVAPPATNAKVAAKAIPGARLWMLPGADHYAFLATCTPAGVAAVPICKLAGAQENSHRVAIELATQLFGRYLSVAAPQAGS